jgi:hypothetical protein
MAKLNGVYKKIDFLGSIGGIIKYGIEWYKRIQQVEEIKNCLKNPPLPINDLNKKAKLDAIEEAKQEIAVSMILKGALFWITDAYDPIRQELKLSKRNVVEFASPLDFVMDRASDNINDYGQDVFDENMDYYIGLAKRLVGPCNQQPVEQPQLEITRECIHKNLKTFSVNECFKKGKVPPLQVFTK